MKTHFITYSDELYKCNQNGLNELGKTQFDVVHSYNRDWLITTDFYLENKDILDEKRGGGYWLWKPYIILETLNKMNEGDILLYMDSGDIFSGNISSYLKTYFQNENSLLTLGGYPQKLWTKRDCFILMGCDEPRFHNHIQLEAGILSFKKTGENVKFINEWLTFSKNKSILTDIENQHGENYLGFKDHRHDQSIITNLAIKYDLNINKLLRKYITCNVNQ